MEYRLARKEELDKCTELLAQAFENYAFFQIIESNEKKHKEFVRGIQAVGARLCHQYGALLVAVQDGEIVAVAGLETPDSRHFNIVDYLLAGGIDVVLAVGIRKAIRWIKLYEKASGECREVRQPIWYLSTLGVSNKCKGQGIGGKMLSGCVKPYIAEHGGGMLAFITNAKGNCAFYQKNGFHECSASILRVGHQEIPNWCFQQMIDSE